jgi:hypothetical protein
MDYFSYIMARIRLATFQWDSWCWCPLCTSPTCLVGSSNWSNSPRYMLGHSDTLSWFPTNQFCSYSLSCVLGREALNAKFISLRFKPTFPLNPYSTTLTCYKFIFTWSHFFKRKQWTSNHLKSQRYHQKVTCMFKDAVHLTRNDEFYLVTDTEGNKGIICFWNPV